MAMITHLDANDQSYFGNVLQTDRDRLAYTLYFVYVTHDLAYNKRK
jgi:hypothetical protein